MHYSVYTTVLCRKPVEELLEQLFSSFDIVTGAKHLKQLCLGEAVDFKQMHSCLRFDSGDCGGVKVVVADDSGLVVVVVVVVVMVVVVVVVVVISQYIYNAPWYRGVCCSADYAEAKRNVLSRVLNVITD